MTEFVIVLSPVVLLSMINFFKYCVKCYARYKEIKFLRNSGAKHVVVAKDYIYFK